MLILYTETILEKFTATEYLPSQFKHDFKSTLYPFSFQKKLVLKIGMELGRSGSIAPLNHKARYALSGRLVPSLGCVVTQASGS